MKAENCSYCGIQISRNVTYKKHCSAECKRDDTYIQRNCKHCGKTFEQRKTAYVKHFCSKECKHSHLYKKVRCAYCGEKKEVLRSEGQKLRFCNKSHKMHYYNAKRKRLTPLPEHLRRPHNL